MASQEVVQSLEECVRAVAATSQSTHRSSCCSCRVQKPDSLCPELASLLQEAMDMTWPFVPERWQYKQAVSANDKTNLSDLISKHLPQLLAFLKASILAQEACSALAVVFLVDRFLYWTDESSRLLNITKLLHRRHPDTPVAPQLVIRQARVYLNAGKLQKAEYILSRLINSSGATGHWVYHSDSDRALVQAVSVQVRGMVLQKLGLWLEAAEFIWASLVGFYALPQPDKKGIGTSLGILANILVSMNDVDFHAFRTNPDIDLQSLLGERGHRLLSAAQAAKMAVVYSQYTSLYVLTNAVTQGTCLLSYSFSVECPANQRESFLLQVSEAFRISLLTKAEGQLVTSKQELHSFLRAAYSLTVAHKWLAAPQEVVEKATQVCQEALAKFYEYDNGTQDKDGLCAEIMRLVNQVKLLLQVEPFLNSDKGSFIPDSYRNIKDTSLSFTLEDFAKVMQKFQGDPASLSQTTKAKCEGSEHSVDGPRLCITSFGTLNTECYTDACKASTGAPKRNEPKQSLDSPAVLPLQECDSSATTESTDSLGSSWQNFSLSSSGSPRPHTGSIAIQRETSARVESYATTEDEDESADSRQQSTNQSKWDMKGAKSHAVPVPAAPATSASSDSEMFEVIQAGTETLDTRNHVGPKLSVTLRSSFSSLGDSFSSQSSWEKLSVELSSPTDTKPQPNSLSKAETAQRSKSPESDRSFVVMERSDSAQDPTLKKHASQWGFSPIPQSIVDIEVDSVCVKPTTKNSSVTPHQNLAQFDPGQQDPTEPCTGSSFDMLEEDQSQGAFTEAATTQSPASKNPSCCSCLKSNSAAAVNPLGQYFLSQEDYKALLAGVCHECLLKRLHSDETKFKLKKHSAAYSALHLKFSKVTGLWTARETCVYIGEPMGLEGQQRAAIRVQFLHQEERLSSYVGKDYLQPKQIQFHLKDVERQMTAQYYVTEFNKRLYEKEVMAQIFFIPSEALLILDGNEMVGCVTVEPFMLGQFVKLTNNKEKTNKSAEATDYGLAFGHFTYLFSGRQEVVVDLQGWVTANGKGLTYLTDPQIHSTKTPKCPGNFAARGLSIFLKEQHGPKCNRICQLLQLPPVVNTDSVPTSDTVTLSF